MFTFCGDPYFPCSVSCPLCHGTQHPLSAPESDHFGFPAYELEPERSVESDPLEDDEVDHMETDPEEASEDHELGYDYDHVDETEDDADDEASMEDYVIDLDGSGGDTSDDSDEEDSESEESSDEELGGESSDEEVVEVIPISSDEESDTTVESPVFRRPGEILRSRDLPLPPPGPQIYRHPGGVRWMHTPRKRVAAIQPRDIFRASIPIGEAPALPAPPEQILTTRLRDAEQEIQRLTDELRGTHREISTLRLMMSAPQEAQQQPPPPRD